MKTYSLVAALSLAAFAGSSFADGATYDYPQPNTSSKTRAEVKAELAQAVAEGRLSTSEADLPQTAFVSTKTRAEVKAELAQAVAQGRTSYGKADWPQVAFVSTKTRAEVNAETLAAIRSGELRRLNREPYSAYVNTAAAPKTGVQQ